MSQPNMLITGATGFIGFKVLLLALKEGYTIRATVRNDAQPAKLISQLEANGLSSLQDRLSFFTVSDVVADDAYDQAVQGVTYVIHLASPLPNPALDPTTGVFEPSVKSVTNILASASKEATIKKVVITASVVGLLTFPPDPSKVHTADTRVSVPPPPFADVGTAYRAAKAAGLNASRDFVEEQKPGFEIVNILPAFNYGRDARASKLEDIWSSTNGLLLAAITGKTSSHPVPTGASDADDVAYLHIQALKNGVVGDYVASADNVVDDAWEFIQKEFPQAVQKGIFSKGHQENFRVKFNSQKTELEFGLKLKSFEDMVRAVASQYLELSGEEKA